jgi:hypothetical protein
VSDILERAGLDLFPEIPHDQTDRLKGVPVTNPILAWPDSLVSACGPNRCARAVARQRFALSGPTGGAGIQDDHHHLLPSWWAI